MRLPRAVGGVVRIGSVRLEVTGQTYPCLRMDEACPGLLRALAKDSRGGITTRVIQDGAIGLGASVDPPEITPRLPG